MTIRECFRAWRAAEDREGYSYADQWYLLLAVRALDWPLAEFYLLLVLSRLVQQQVGAHVWQRSADGYHWCCTWCGARVPSDEIDEVAPPSDYFCGDPTCTDPACHPCLGRPT